MRHHRHNQCAAVTMFYHLIFHNNNEIKWNNERGSGQVGRRGEESGRLSARQDTHTDRYRDRDRLKHSEAAHVIRLWSLTRGRTAFLR